MRGFLHPARHFLPPYQPTMPVSYFSRSQRHSHADHPVHRLHCKGAFLWRTQDQGDHARDHLAMPSQLMQPAQGRHADHCSHQHLTQRARQPVRSANPGAQLRRTSFCKVRYATPLDTPGHVPHDPTVAKTNATWFGDQHCKWRMTAARRYFFVRTLLRAFYGRAIAGRAHALPVSICAGSPTLLSARPPHLAMGRGFNSQMEADMANLSSPRAPASRRVTRRTRFFSCNPQGERLFSVRAGISADDALEQASCFLDSALDIASDLVNEHQANGSIAAVAYLIEMSKAVVDAATLSLAKDAGND